MSDQQNHLGLQILVEPEQPLLDIVAVHGLAADPSRTWKSRTNDVLWLKDLLPEYAPNARISTFNYSSNWLGNTPKISIRGIASNLCEVLIDDQRRRGGAPRNFLLIGHSFGGIVIEEAILYASQRDEYLNIINYTKGVILLGTPLRGSGMTTWAKTAVNCAKALGLDTHDGLLNILKEESEYLGNLRHDFTRVAIRKKINISCFYETRETPLQRKGILKRIKKTMIVPQTAAIFEIGNSFALNTDHTGMNKFDSRDNEDFVRVRSQIMSMIDSMEQFIDTDNIDSSNIETANTVKKHYFIVPYNRNSIFTPRIEVADKFQSLFTNKAKDEQLRLAIHGLGGSGKTQFVLDMVFRLRADYHIFWIFGSSPTDFVSKYSQFAQDMQMPIIDENPMKICSQVRNFLEALEDRTHRDFILVIDNADDLSEDYIETVHDLLPRHAGIILFTTRDRSIVGKLIERSDHCVTINEKMTFNEAQKTFYSRVGRRSDDYGYDENTLIKLLTRLEALPLAIVQAASYIQTRNITIEKYLEIFNDDAAEVLLEPVREVGAPNRAVMTTWKISYMAISEANPRATSLLKVLSFLSPSEIQEELLEKDKLALFNRQFELEDALSLLQDFALISVFYSTNNTRAFRMHRLVNLWTANLLEGPTFNATIKYAINILHCKFKQYSLAGLAHFTTIVPHVEALQQRSQSQRPKYLDLDQGKLLLLTAVYYRDAAQLQVAAQYLDECREIFEKEGHQELILCEINDRGLLAERHGNLDDALQLFERALFGRRKQFGRKHPDTLKTLSSIAWVFVKQDQYDKAMKLFEQVQSDRGETPAHNLDTLTTINDMATVHDYQGHHSQALQLYERVLAGREKALSKDHPETLATVYGIAVLYKNQGQYDKAIQWHNRALTGAENIMGKDHPETLLIVNDIAVSYNYQGQYDMALQLFERVLSGYENIFGKDHSKTIVLLHNLAAIYSKKGQHDKALEWFKRALCNSKEKVDEQNNHTLATVSQMAFLYAKQEKYDDALQYFERALSGYDKMLGRNHPTTLTTVYGMAIVYDARKQYALALPLFEEAYSTSQTSCDITDSFTLPIAWNLVKCYKNMNQYTSALEIGLKVIPRLVELYGNDDKRTIRMRQLINEVSDKIYKDPDFDV